MFQRFYTLARNTFVETLGQPIYGVILLAATGLLVLNVSLAAFTLEDDDKLLLDLGLSTLLLSGLFLSVFSAAGVLSREIENKTVLMVLAKPITRPVFFLAKFAGLLGALAIAHYLLVLVFVLAQRHGVLQSSADPWDAPVLAFGFGAAVLSLLGAALANYLYGRRFATTAIALIVPLLTLAVLLTAKFGKEFELVAFGTLFVGGQVLIAAYLVFLATMVIAAVALAASSRFGTVMTLLISVFVLALGITSDYALGQHDGESVLASFLYRVVPNMGPYWVIDGLHSASVTTAVPGHYVAITSLYALLITVGILNIGIVAFQKREVG